MRSSLDAASAWRIRRAPSKLKGLVTTPTVRMPISRATSATMGLPPVPVPPPMPQVTNTMSVPSSALAMELRFSSADLRPTSGLALALAVGQLLADLNLISGRRLGQRLLVCIDGDKIHAGGSADDHAVDHVIA